MGDTMRHAYFPLSGLVSLLSSTEDGETIEVAMVGNEGVVGVSILLRVGVTPYRTVVQIPCTAMRIRAEAFKREFGRSERLQDLLLRYTQSGEELRGMN